MDGQVDDMALDMGRCEMKEIKPIVVAGHVESGRTEDQRPTDAVPCPTNERAGGKCKMCVEMRIFTAIVEHANDTIDYLDGEELLVPRQDGP